jgi:hypothetical protein
VNELDQNLLTGEQVVFETTKHWFAPVRASLIAVLLLLGALALRWLSPSGDGLVGSIGGLLDLISTGVLIVGILWIVYNIAEFLSAHFGVTNMRVLRYEGLVRRRSSETLLPMLTDVRLVEPALGRMLGFGDLRILTSSGAAGEDEFKTVKGAAALRTAIQEQKATGLTGAPQAVAAPAPVGAAPAPVAALANAAPAPPPDDASTTLARLAQMRDQGLITAQDYEAKKAEILGRM